MSYPSYGYPAYGYGPPPDHPQATTILVLGILGLVLCQLLGPVAWIMGSKARREIDASGGTLGGRGNVTAGYVCGIVATCLMLLYFVIFAIAIGAGLSSS
ncbi:DUF4190 domain-containing protein [Nocardia otitidiscaviarum]|uniref:DUF4190 domain-containing protein n=1 Tax=Nocardia otitidiscaviarum TaxID=1823 RepID=A0A516NVG3_9NOCA|nr:DUF4190 domain-containing protein [Nocardia otitidiscaviarum]MCP9622326.1 DUF4190 domain-containing protein [Nocardia otitidiscaviarum]QDP82864.1 DUF4190 domain-containing protein [Nocardia otitidiscaviarum]